jgi:hypothetical protein
LGGGFVGLWEVAIFLHPVGEPGEDKSQHVEHFCTRELPQIVFRNNLLLKRFIK